jgi:hypothetical protein
MAGSCSQGRNIRSCHQHDRSPAKYGGFGRRVPCFASYESLGRDWATWAAGAEPICQAAGIARKKVNPAGLFGTSSDDRLAERVGFELPSPTLPAAHYFAHFERDDQALERRSISFLTAVRMKAERSSPSVRDAPMRSSTDLGQRIGTITVLSPIPPSGFLPMGAGVAAKIS